MIDNTTYQGYTNYQTWAVGLWLDNDHDYNKEALRLVREDKDCSDRVLGEKLDEYVQSIVFDQEGVSQQGLSTDILTHALANVNWTELAQEYRKYEQ